MFGEESCPCPCVCHGLTGGRCGFVACCANSGRQWHLNHFLDSGESPEDVDEPVVTYNPDDPLGILIDDLDVVLEDEKDVAERDYVKVVDDDDEEDDDEEDEIDDDESD